MGIAIRSEPTDSCGAPPSPQRRVSPDSRARQLARPSWTLGDKFSIGVCENCDALCASCGRDQVGLHRLPALITGICVSPCSAGQFQPSPTARRVTNCSSCSISATCDLTDPEHYFLLDGSCLQTYPQVGHTPMATRSRAASHATRPAALALAAAPPITRRVLPASRTRRAAHALPAVADTPTPTPSASHVALAMGRRRATAIAGNGTYCEDIDECAIGTHGCHAMANCTSMLGSYECECKTPGFEGNGVFCTDINESRPRAERLPPQCGLHQPGGNPAAIQATMRSQRSATTATTASKAPTLTSARSEPTTAMTHGPLHGDGRHASRALQATVAKE